MVNEDLACLKGETRVTRYHPVPAVYIQYGAMVMTAKQNLAQERICCSPRGCEAVPETLARLSNIKFKVEDAHEAKWCQVFNSCGQTS